MVPPPRLFSVAGQKRARGGVGVCRGILEQRPGEVKGNFSVCAAV